MSGGLAKTSVAPLERVKILFQTGKIQPSSVGRTLQDIFRSEGVQGMFRWGLVRSACFATVPRADVFVLVQSSLAALRRAPTCPSTYSAGTAYPAPRP